MTAMREKISYMLYTFPTTSAAMAMESICAGEGIPGRLVPVPSEVAAGCGYGWRMTKEEHEIYGSRIAELGLTFERIAEIRAWK